MNRSNPANPNNSSNPADPSNPPEPSHQPDREHVEKDDGLRRLLTWTFIALGVTLILAAIGVSLAVYWFDSAHP